MKPNWATIRSALNKPINIPGLAQRKTRKTPSPSAKWFGRIVIWFFILLCASFTIWRTSVSVRVHSHLRAIGKRGEPIDAQALNVIYRAVPEQENAALLWMQGYEQLVPPPRKGAQSPWSKLDVPRRRIAMSNELLKAAEGLVRSNTAALGTFREAATLPRSRYPIDLSGGLGTDMSHLAHLKSATQLLRLETIVASESGDTNRAVTAILTILAAGRSLQSEPTYMSMLVRCAIDNIAYQATEYLINRLKLSDSHLQHLSAAFALMEDNEALARALAAERAMLVSVLNNPEWVYCEEHGNNEDTRRSAFEKAVGPSLIRLSGFFQRDLSFCLASFNTTMRDARLADPERFRARSEWDKIGKRANGGYYIMSGLLLPALSKSVIKDVDHRARGRVAQTVLAIERYRLDHGGKLPEGLNSLTPGLSAVAMRDPFDAQPLRYKTWPNGYVVYSIGADTADDGGAERSSGKKRNNEPEDITFVIER